MFEDLRDGVRHSLAREGHATGEHFKEHTAKRPDVAALIDGDPTRLLGAHVRGRAHDGGFAPLGVQEQRCIREVVTARRDDGLREAEIEYLDHALSCDLDVRRLQVAVNDPLFVRFFQCPTDLASNVQRILYRQRAWRRALREDLLKSPSIDEHRLSSQSLLDVRLSKTLRIGGIGRIAVLVDVLNALNDAAEESLATDNVFSPNFMQPTVFLDPRRAVLGVRLNLGR